LILSNAIASQLSRLWIRLTESEKQVMNYLAQQDDAVTVSQILQAIPHPPTELLKAIESLKRRCFLEDTLNLVGASNMENYGSALLKINSIFKHYLSSLPLLPTWTWNLALLSSQAQPQAIAPPATNQEALRSPSSPIKIDDDADDDANERDDDVAGDDWIKIRTYVVSSLIA